MDQILVFLVFVKKFSAQSLRLLVIIYCTLELQIAIIAQDIKSFKQYSLL
jgi:hypothetical protein